VPDDLDWSRVFEELLKPSFAIYPVTPEQQNAELLEVLGPQGVGTLREIPAVADSQANTMPNAEAI